MSALPDYRAEEMRLRVVRRPTRHDSSPKHVAGSATFIDDMREPEGLLHMAVGGAPCAYDFPPHVVDVATTFEQRHLEDVDGALVLRDSPWDPIARYLPVAGTPTAQLVTQKAKARHISNAGPLDPEAFWPHADVIGGSRWPGAHGAPRPA